MEKETKICDCCSGRKKSRSEDETRDLVNRLSRIEGQVRGVKGMVERGDYCTDIITQVAAINAALSSFNKKLLEAHIKTCVTTDLQNGEYESRDELVELLGKLIK